METTVFTAEQYKEGLITLSLLNRAAFERFTESTWLAFDEDYQGPASDEEAVEYIAELHTQAYSTLARRGYSTKFESNQLRRALITARSEKDDAERKANSDAVQALYN